MKQTTPIHSETARLKHLACAPGIIFMLVASADGDIDKKKLKRFATLMASKDYAILASMLEQAGASISDLLDEVLTNKLDPYQKLQSVCSILDVYLSAQAAQTYKLTLLRLAKDITRASREKFCFFNRKPSEAQRTAISIVAGLLGLLDDAQKHSTIEEPIVPAISTNTDSLSLSNLPDTLYPVLKSAEWAENINTTALTQPINKKGEKTPQEPVVAYALDSSEIVDFLSLNSVHETLTAKMIHEKAMQNLETKLRNRIKWNELEFDSGNKEVGSVSGIVLNGDYFCSEALLSQTILNTAHQHLETDSLMAITPVRGELYITRLTNKDQPDPAELAFAQFAVARFFNPLQVQISPNVWIIHNGNITGCIANMDNIIKSAKQCALQSKQDDRLFFHSAKTYWEGKGIGLELDVVTKDLDMLISDLQDLIRSYLDPCIKQKSFSGNLRIHLNIQDPDYSPEMKGHVSEQLATMSEFLCQQFSSLDIKTTNDTNIRLFCSLVD